jgi:formate-dependent nitrite reductase membrane component NrfD
METEQPAIVGDSFALGYRFQRYWTGSMATAFFFGELGAGLFVVSLLYDVVPGMVAGLVATGILKPYFHLAHMGVPARAWRAIMRPDRSWISRGMISIGFFVVFGAAHLLLQSGVFGLDSGGGDGILARATTLIAVLGAVGVMLYHGFAISHSTAISLWSTGLMPVAGVAYAFLGGASLTAVLGRGAPVAGMPSLNTVILVLLAVTAFVLISLMSAAWNGAPGARVSMNLLLKGRYARVFVPVVIGAGLVLPALLLLQAPSTLMTSLLVAVAVLAGYYAFRIYIFKAGVYDPVMSFAPTLRTA